MRTIYLDLPLDDESEILPGDVISGPKRRWRVIEAWQTESRLWGNRWTLKVGPSGSHQLQPDAGRIVVSSEPYRPGELPQDAFPS